MSSPETAAAPRVLIVDHKPDSRAELERLCRANGLQTLPPADTATFALRHARMLRPHLVLVDTDLPDMTGLDLLENLGTDTIAGIVIATRTDLAARAFETGAVDYLVKPFSEKRFAQAITRASAWLAAAAARGQPGTHDRRATVNEAEPLPLLIGERQQRLHLLHPARIEYVEAEGNYVTFHVNRNEYVSRDTLKRLELLLGQRGFLRIENSVLLNVGAIDYVIPFGRGRFVFTLRSGITLRSTLTYRASILARLPLAKGRREQVFARI